MICHGYDYATNMLAVESPWAREPWHVHPLAAPARYHATRSCKSNIHVKPNLHVDITGRNVDNVDSPTRVVYPGGPAPREHRAIVTGLFGILPICSSSSTVLLLYGRAAISPAELAWCYSCVVMWSRICLCDNPEPATTCSQNVPTRFIRG